MKKIMAIVWLIIPPFILTALIASTDADVNGLAGLFAPEVYLPLIAVALIFAFLAWIIQFVYTPSRTKKLILINIGISAIWSVFICLLGSTAKSFIEISTSFFGMTLLTFLMIITAALPAVLIKRTSLNQKNRMPEAI